MNINNVCNVVSIGTSKPPVRFAINFENENRCIFSYFPIGKDLSIAVQTYHVGNASWMINFNKPACELSSDERTILDREFSEHAKDFRPQKFSFHQSGTNNAKDTAGVRYPNDNDARSVPFHAVKDTIRLLYMYPTAWQDYPVCNPTNKKPYNVFPHRPLAFPPMVEIRLAKNGYDLIGELNGAYKEFDAFVDYWSLRPLELSIYTILRRSSNKRLPLQHILIAEKHQKPL